MSGDPYVKENEELRAEIEKLRTWLGDSEMTASKLRAALEQILASHVGNYHDTGRRAVDIARKALAKEGK